jgi:hypothetical protein
LQGGAKARPPAEDSCRLGLFPQSDPASLTEKVRRRVVRWFRMKRFLDADAGANGVVELSPFEFLDRLADLVSPRKIRP